MKTKLHMAKIRKISKNFGVSKWRRFGNEKPGRAACAFDVRGVLGSNALHLEFAQSHLRWAWPKLTF